MKQTIYIKDQKALDDLKEIGKDQEVIIESTTELSLNVILEVFGVLKINTKVKCSRYSNRFFRAMPNSSVVARENSSVEARGNSSVVAWGNSSVEARGNSSVEARENSSVEARENSSVVARENSSVVARENSSVEAWENSSVKILNDLFRGVAKMFGYSAIWIPNGLKFKLEIKSKTATKIVYEQGGYLDREGVEIEKGNVILFKRVSSDFKTQEGTKNETVWSVGSTLEHPNWTPGNGECGEGKYHACSRPYFCDEFRSNKGDKYIAIQVNKKDLHEWKNPTYPHKIAFRKCIVLFECNRFGKELKA